MAKNLVKAKRNHKGQYIDKFGKTLPDDNYMVSSKKEQNRSIGLRIVNPDVAKDIRKGSFVFGRISALAAKRKTKKRHRAKAV